MKNSNKMIVGTSALVAVILAGAYSYSSAYRGDYAQKGPNYTEERHEAMEKAFDGKDYDAWKKLMEEAPMKGRVLDVVNKDNFSKFAEAHKLMEEGKNEEARKLRAELGLGLRNGEGNGMRGQGRMMNNENRGQNVGGNFIDANGDGKCDHLNQ